MGVVLGWALWLLWLRFAWLLGFLAAGLLLVACFLATIIVSRRSSPRRTATILHIKYPLAHGPYPHPGEPDALWSAAPSGAAHTHTHTPPPPSSSAAAASASSSASPPPPQPPPPTTTYHHHQLPSLYRTPYQEQPISRASPPLRVTDSR
ncbi:hypothetical protein BZA05DRAFT_122930 [Tricharina praecox]|uniref:uncharacterized protein n=1 Tax=Tricharina praecox TaxID=43433 RepID=UPI00221E6B3F|nr:uncharacterized protein BZA05DRAFT_122930 [Tricharina praecox]KAI5847436.1 hypothetical protein BZA05DRAFT_122930 [Tricharina praecox]